MSISSVTLAARPRHAHIFEREEHSHYVENPWCSRALFRDVPFYGLVHDPACGFGNIVMAAREAGFEASEADIVDRGFEGTRVRDFLRDPRRYPNIVSNPPYEIIAAFGPHAVAASFDRTALLFPTARLHAAGAGWLRGLPLRPCELALATALLAPRRRLPGLSRQGPRAQWRPGRFLLVALQARVPRTTDARLAAA